MLASLCCRSRGRTRAPPSATGPGSPTLLGKHGGQGVSSTQQGRARLSPPMQNSPNSDNIEIGFLGFFFNDTATTEIYTLSLHDALPIFASKAAGMANPSPRR